MSADVAASPASSAAPGVRVEGADESTQAAWDAFARVHPEATFFHRWGWQRVVRQTFGYRPAHLIARRDGRVAGILPLFVVPALPWGCALVSAPQAVYGGPIADADDARAALVVRAHEMAEREGARYVEYRNMSALPDLPSKDLYETFRRPILPTDEENMAATPGKQRYSIRVGLKNQLTAEVGRGELLGPFFDVYSESVRNLGTPVFPRRLFAKVLDEFGEDARILLVRREGRPSATALLLFHRDEVHPYYAGGRRADFKYAVNDFMYWSLFRYAREQGCKTFNFGRSKRGTGAFDFKRHWGFVSTPLHYQYDLVGQRSLPDMSPKNPKFSFAVAAWKRMPLWLSRRVGPALVRYFP